MADYNPSTKVNLTHYFSNQVGGMRVILQMKTQGIYGAEKVETVAQESRRDFIAGIEGVLKKLSRGDIPKAEGVGESQLREILDVAKNSDNWTKPETIRKLYEAYSAITGEEFEESIFEGME